MIFFFLCMHFTIQLEFVYQLVFEFVTFHASRNFALYSHLKEIHVSRTLDVYYRFWIQSVYNMNGIGNKCKFHRSNHK